MIKLPKTWPQDIGEAYYPCRRCGIKEKEVELRFDSGSVAPTVGETLTGATSGDTGVVTEVELVSGAWDGSATGYVTMDTYTGGDAEQFSCFDDGELINGSLGGNSMLMADWDGTVKVYGRLYPKNQTVEYNGQRYCTPHYKAIAEDEWQDWSAEVDEVTGED